MQIAIAVSKKSYLKECVRLLKPRIQFEQEMIAKGEYLFVAPTEYDSAVVSKRWKPTLQPFFSSLLSAWEEVKTFDAAEAEQTFKHTSEKII